jgi:hypothetical protein
MYVEVCVSCVDFTPPQPSPYQGEGASLSKKIHKKTIYINLNFYIFSPFHASLTTKSYANQFVDKSKYFLLQN